MRKPTVLTLTKVSAGDTNEDILFPQYRNKSVFCLQYVSASDDTTASVTCDVGIVVGGVFQVIVTLSLTTNALTYGQYLNIYFPADQRILFRFKGTVSGDILTAAIFGFAGD